MKNANLEPGLLSVFRFFALLNLAVRALEPFQMMHISATGALGQQEYQLAARFALFSMITAIVLVIWLMWPGLQRYAGRGYLPIGLLIAAAGTLIGDQKLVIDYQLEGWTPGTLIQFLEALVSLLVVVALIAWQYRFRMVAAFVLGTGLLALIMTTTIFRSDAVSFEDAGYFILARTLLSLVAGYLIVRLMTAQRQQRAALAHYAATLEQLAVSRERNRMARELHDTLAHTLSGTALELEAAKTLWEADQVKAHALLDRSLSAVREGLTETRRALQALRAAPLEDLGLSLAVRELAEATAAQIGATLCWQGEARLDQTPAAIEQCVYRVAQEALENIARHAAAQQIGVKLSRNNRHLNLEVSDNGCGFDLSAVDTDQHFGLKGLHERADMVGGQLEVESQPQHGTTIRFSVEVSDDSRPHLR